MSYIENSLMTQFSLVLYQVSIVIFYPKIALLTLLMHNHNLYIAIIIIIMKNLNKTTTQDLIESCFLFGFLVLIPKQ